MALSKNDSKKIAVAAARCGDDKHAEPIAVLDLCGRSTLTDFVVMMNVESVPQLEAVEEEIVRRLKHEGVYCLYRDGMRSRSWKVLDYGGVLVHILDPEAAARFSLAELYAGAKPVEWRPAPPPQEREAAPAKKQAKKAAPKKAAPKKPAAKKAAPKAAAKKPVKKPAKKPAKRPAKKASKKK